MFITRLISGIVLMVIIGALNVLGGLPLFGFITVISIIGMYELFGTAKLSMTAPAFVCYIAGILIDIVSLENTRQFLYVHFSMSRSFAINAIIGAAFILIMFIYVFTFPKYTTQQVTMFIFGLIYVALFLSCVMRVRYMPKGIYNVWLIYICAWGSDTCAYCVGRLIGKHHLPAGFHKLSPKKTIEGCVGGVVGSALIGLIFAIIVYKQAGTVAGITLACAVGALIGQVGDLAASAIKRNYEIKDYGKLIPGHGGIMDRFDSILFTAPVVFIILSLIIK